MTQQPAHRVVQIAVIDWANGLSGRAPVGDDLSRLIASLTEQVERDRATPAITITRETASLACLAIRICQNAEHRDHFAEAQNELEWALT